MMVVLDEGNHQGDHERDHEGGHEGGNEGEADESCQCSHPLLRFVIWVGPTACG